MTNNPRPHPTPESPQPERMPARHALPLERGEANGGGLTGATGVLTPEDEPGQFMPAERREIENARHIGQAALKQHPAARGDGQMGADAAGSLAGPLATNRSSGLTGQMADGGMDGSATPAAGTQAGSGRSEMGTADGGYGGEQGLAADDPAYRGESDIPGEIRR